MDWGGMETDMMNDLSKIAILLNALAKEVNAIPGASMTFDIQVHFPAETMPELSRLEKGLEVVVKELGDHTVIAPPFVKNTLEWTLGQLGYLWDISASEWVLDSFESKQYRHARYLINNWYHSEPFYTATATQEECFLFLEQRAYKWNGEIWTSG